MYLITRNLSTGGSSYPVHNPTITGKMHLARQTRECQRHKLGKHDGFLIAWHEKVTEIRQETWAARRVKFISFAK